MAGVRAATPLWRLKALAPDATILDFDLTASTDAITAILLDNSIDGIVHTAAYGVEYHQADFEAAFQVNVSGSRRLVLAAKSAGCRRIVHIGSCMEYGTHDGAVSEDLPLRPRGVYAVSKACATLALLDAGRAAGVDVAVIRPWSMYGPLEKLNKFVPLVMEAGRTRRRVDLTPGEQVRDYVYVTDVAQGVADLISRADFPAGETFNFGSGKTIRLRSLGEAAMHAVSGDQSLLVWGAAVSLRRSDVLAGRYGKSAGASGWQASTTLAEGLWRTASYPSSGVLAS